MHYVGEQGGFCGVAAIGHVDLVGDGEGGGVTFLDGVTGHHTSSTNDLRALVIAVDVCLGEGVELSCVEERNGHVD